MHIVFSWKQILNDKKIQCILFFWKQILNDKNKKTDVYCFFIKKPILNYIKKTDANPCYNKLNIKKIK